MALAQFTSLLSRKLLREFSFNHSMHVTQDETPKTPGGEKGILTIGKDTWLRWDKLQEKSKCDGFL